VLFVSDGMILEEGPPEAIFSSPTHERTRQFLHRIVDI
jgi:polar amino acid transport system ATP-binding protein